MSRQNIERIMDDQSIFAWQHYDPNEAQYTRYAESLPSVIAAGYKISNVYYSICSARASAYYSIIDDYGDLAGEGDTNHLYVQAHFLTSAILEYALCLDMAWQVVWAYIQPSSFEYLVEQKNVELEKDCTRDSIISQLDCVISMGGHGIQQASELRSILVKFDQEECVLKLRRLYNSIKHHSSIQIKGLGMIDDSFSVTILGMKIKKLSRPVYTLDEIEELLEQYHFKFVDFFNSIISKIMPDDYCNNSVPFIDFLNTALKMYSVQKRR